jgi:hypothetical protein
LTAVLQGRVSNVQNVTLRAHVLPFEGRYG